ncbi:TetR/AcrR family transcriptional regulator [Occultella glacieicola]|uniref:TetR/AcrR family transcriptional regulator n=1 Tax=Occultella glacieicola TaxID=2518684 RepID=A0ABY2E4H7_9MICO|nr:TetR/AcrR family transcriptional regulator [Occultella glacieicola]TDE94939.1 TetR/AcrR family transcriptional regulator [Occultella glacieicola]
MPRTVEQNEVIRAATRDTIRTAAVREFARRGFAAASIRGIAAEAGLSTGSIYRHYATKDELFDELLTQAAIGLSATAARLAEPGRPLDLVREFAATYLTDLQGDDGEAEFFMVINQGFTSDTPAGTTARLASAHEALWRAFAELVRHGQREGAFGAGDPDRLAVGFFAMLTGLTTLRLALGRDLPLPDADLVLRTLTGGDR